MDELAFILKITKKGYRVKILRAGGTKSWITLTRPISWAGGSYLRITDPPPPALRPEDV